LLSACLSCRLFPLGCLRPSFFAATINYIDRQVIGLVKPLLQREFAWSEIDYGNIVFAFQLAYAIALPLSSKVRE
jgi:MFS transporter, ACS family, hexuronate transporter